MSNNSTRQTPRGILPAPLHGIYIPRTTQGRRIQDKHGEHQPRTTQRSSTRRARSNSETNGQHRAWNASDDGEPKLNGHSSQTVPAPLMGSGTHGPLRWSAPYGSDTRHDATTRLSDPSRKRPLIDWAALLTCRKPQEESSRQAFCCASEKQQQPGSAKHTIQASPLRKGHHWSQSQAQHSTAQHSSTQHRSSRSAANSSPQH